MGDDWRRNDCFWSRPVDLGTHQESVDKLYGSLSDFLLKGVSNQAGEPYTSH